MDNKNSNEPDALFNDQNDFNRNVLENGINGNIPQQISVADETGQMIPVSGSNTMVLVAKTPAHSNQNWTQTRPKPIMKQELMAQPSSNRHHGSHSSNQQSSVNKINSRVEGLKNTHEDLRRRASYRRIYDTINPGCGKPDNGNHTHQLTSSFTQPQDHQRSSPLVNPSTVTPSSSGQSQQANLPESSFPIPDVKREINPPSINPPSTDDSDSDDGHMETISPTTMLPTTVQIPAAPDSQPILVPVGPNQAQMPPYSTPTNSHHYPNMQHTNDLISRAQSTLMDSYMPNPDLDVSLSDGSGMGAGGECGPVKLVQEAARKREVRLLKNREAARECRRKKKEYIKCLENRVQVLEQQNKALIGELENLKEMYCHNQP